MDKSFGVISDSQKLRTAERLERLLRLRIDPETIQSVSGSGIKGGSAQVVEGHLRRPDSDRVEHVAIKRVHPLTQDGDEKLFKEFVNEVEILSKLDHENVVQMIGFVEEFENDRTWIIFPWAPDGNLREFIASGEWEIPERVSLIQDMFRGLSYLHGGQPRIRHGDIKSINILVNDRSRAVITDFGSARLIQEPQPHEDGQSWTTTEDEDQSSRVTIGHNGELLTLTGPKWTLRWVAPEVLMEEDTTNLASDVWSAAWVCWEVITGQLPFADIKSEGKLILHIAECKVPNIRENEQLAQVIALCSLMMDCWTIDPKQRLTTTQVYAQIRWMNSYPPAPRAQRSIGVGGQAGSRSNRLLLSLARIHYHRADHPNAISLALEVLRRTQEGDPEDEVVMKDEADAQSILGSVHSLDSKLAQAEKCLMRADEIYTRIGDDSGRAFVLNGLGDVYRMLSKFDEAKKCFAQVQEMCTRTGDDIAEANAFSGLGHMYLQQSEYEKAKQCQIRAHQVHTSVSNNIGIANALRALGDICCMQLKNDEARAFYIQLRELCSRIEYALGAANALYGLGELGRLDSEYEESERFFIQAQEIYSRIGNHYMQGNALRGLGDVCSKQARYDTAKQYYTQLQNLSARTGSELARADALFGLGDMYRAQSKFDEAGRSLTRAQEIYARIGSTAEKANVSMALGHLRRLESQEEEAREHYEEAQRLYTSIGLNKYGQKASRWLELVTSKPDSGPE